MILAIAFYFTLFWGFDALRMLTSPTYGLDDVWRSQFVFGSAGSSVSAPLGLIKLAAFFATIKLAVAGDLRHAYCRPSPRARRRQGRLPKFSKPA